jgi:hypothetical protein
MVHPLLNPSHATPVENCHECCLHLHHQCIHAMTQHMCCTASLHLFQSRCSRFLLLQIIHACACRLQQYLHRLYMNAQGQHSLSNICIHHASNTTSRLGVTSAAKLCCNCQTHCRVWRGCLGAHVALAAKQTRPPALIQVPWSASERALPVELPCPACAQCRLALLRSDST